MYPHKTDPFYSSYLPARKSNTLYTPTINYHHVSRSLERPSSAGGSSYTSSYLIRKGPKKVGKYPRLAAVLSLRSNNNQSNPFSRHFATSSEEPSRDYNFEEYFRILPPHLYSRYYDSHKILNHGRRFFPNLRLNLNRGLFTKPSSTSSSIVSTPSSVQCSRSPSPVPVSSRPTSPHFGYDFTSELVDGIHLSRAKSPMLSRPLSPISTQLSAQLSSPLASSKNLSAALPSGKTRSKSSHTVRTPPPPPLPSVKRNDKTNLDDNESQTDGQPVGQPVGQSVPKSECPKATVRKTKSHHALNEPSGRRLSGKGDFNGSENQVDLNDSNSNLIKILSQNIIELTENLNLLFNEHSNEHGKAPADASRTKSTETLKDNDLIDKIDQLRKVSKKLQDCAAQQQPEQQQQPPVQTVSNEQPITSLADQLNVVEQVDLIDSQLQAEDKLELEFAECQTTFADCSDQVQVHQQLVMQSAAEQANYDQSFDENNNQFNEQNQDRKLRKTASSSSANRLQVDDAKQPQRDESQEDEFYECANEEQKDLRKALFKGSKLNLEQLIDKAIDEQLLGQWLKLSDSLDNEDGPVQQKHSVEELKHKFATKLAIIHYKLYQKYSKTKPINVKKWRHRKLNKCNKIQSKYTLLQGLMDDDQFIQFLMDKISYFMRKIRQSKSQRKELKKSISKLDLEPEPAAAAAVRRESEPERKLKQQFEFDKDSLKDESVLDENNNEVPEDRKVLDENNNEISIDRLDKQANSPSIERELDRLNEIKQELQQEFMNDDLMKEELIKELNEEIIRDLSVDSLTIENGLNEDEDEMKAAKKGTFLSKYALLFLFTLIIFMILIVLFRSLSFGEVKKCTTNCGRNQLDSGQLVLQPVSVQLRQQTAKYLPACDHRIMLEAQKLLGPK